MPRMPTEDEIGLPGIRSPGVPRRIQDGLGAAVRRAGAVAGRIGDQIATEDAADLDLAQREYRRKKSEDDAIDLTRARSAWNVSRLTEEDKANPEVDPDYSKWEPRYAQNVRKQRDEVAKAIRDPRVREQFLAETEDDITRGTFSIRDRARTLDRGKREGEALAGLESDIAAAARPNIPKAEQDAILARARANIDNLASTGVITPERAIGLRQGLAKRFAGLKVQGDIQNDPSAAYRNLEGSPGEIFFSKLRRKESGGSDTAKAATSSATGRYQFTDATWKQVMANHPELGLTADGRTSAEQQERAIRAFTSDNTQALQAAGVPVSEASLYLAHFMGAGGAVKMLQADPGANAAALFPEAANANSTIFFTPDGAARSVGEVIALQTKGFDNRGGPAPEYYALLEPEDRLRLSASAQAQWAANEKQAREVSQLEAYRLRSAMDDDIAQIEATGTPSDLNPQSIVDTLGEDDAAKWLDKRKAAAETYEAVSVIPSMTNDEIEAHLSDLEPEAGAESFERRQKTYDAAEKKAKTIMDLRFKDPAKSVEDSPLVREAMKTYNPEYPASVQTVIKARIAAQDAVGIPKALQQPVTRREALEIVRPIETVLNMADANILTQSKGDTALRRQVRKQEAMNAEAEIRKMLDGVEQQFGPYAQEVMAIAIAESVKDREVGNLTARVYKKIQAGERPSIQDMSGIQDATEASVAEKAMDGALPKPAPIPQTPGRGPARPAAKPAQPAAPAGGWPAPSPDAVKDLMANPGKAEAFDALFGPGAASQWLPKVKE